MLTERAGIHRLDRGGDAPVQPAAIARGQPGIESLADQNVAE